LGNKEEDNLTPSGKKKFGKRGGFRRLVEESPKCERVKEGRMAEYF